MDTYTEHLQINFDCDSFQASGHGVADVWHGLVWHGVGQVGMVWHCFAWYGTRWHDMAKAHVQVCLKHVMT